MTTLLSRDRFFLADGCLVPLRSTDLAASALVLTTYYTLSELYFFCFIGSALGSEFSFFYFIIGSGLGSELSFFYVYIGSGLVSKFYFFYFIVSGLGMSICLLEDYLR
jgi:hypothetical protein